MQEFKVASKRAAQEDDEVIEIPFGDRTLISKIPTPGQSALFYARLVSPATEEERDNGPVNAVFGLLRSILADGDVPYLKQLLGEGRIEFSTLFGGDDENPSGLVEELLRQASGRPTEPSSDSSPSQKSTGRPSTGRTPGKGSIRSKASPSTDS